MRRHRAGFLEVAIEVEADIRAALADYFVAEVAKRPLFATQFVPDRAAFGTLVHHLLAIIDAEAERFDGFNADDREALKRGLTAMVEHRNRLAHEPMHFAVE